jgi:hypothetical protein
MRNLSMIVLAVICVTGCAAPAGAQPGRRSSDEGPHSRDMHRIRSLSVELDQAAESWIESLRRSRRAPGWQQDTTLRDAERFRVVAHDFRIAVNRNMGQPSRTVDAFERVHQAFDRLIGGAHDASGGRWGGAGARTGQRWPWGQTDARNDPHFRRIESLVSDLERYYPSVGYAQADWRRLRMLGIQIDDQASTLYNEARRELNTRYRDSASRDALRRLEDLQAATRVLRREVDTQRPDPVRVRREYDRTAQAYSHALGRIAVHKSNIRRDLQRIGTLLAEFEKALGITGQQRWGYQTRTGSTGSGPEGVWDRDRDRDWDRDRDDRPR